MIDTSKILILFPFRFLVLVIDATGWLGRSEAALPCTMRFRHFNWAECGTLRATSNSPMEITRVVCNANPSRTQNAADSSKGWPKRDKIRHDTLLFTVYWAAYAKRNFLPTLYSAFHKRWHAVSRRFLSECKERVKCIVRHMSLDIGNYIFVALSILNFVVWCTCCVEHILALYESFGIL